MKSGAEISCISFFPKTKIIGFSLVFFRNSLLILSHFDTYNTFTTNYPSDGFSKTIHISECCVDFVVFFDADV